jgi:alpha-D-xyloside xylohydrolase
MLVLLLACHRDEPAVGGYTAAFDADSRTLTLARDGDPLLVFASDGLQLGLLPALDDAKSYDPVYPDATVAWETPASAEPAGDAVFALTYADAAASLTITDLGGDRFGVALVPDAGTPAGYVRLRATVDPTEGFYGLGETFDTPEHRGKVRPMQMELDLTTESSDSETHVPVPLLIGTTGWGLFVKDRHPGLFEVATEADDVVQTTWGIGMDADSGLRFELYGADRPIDITGKYYESTVPPLLPATWAYGPWIWRDENTSQAQFEDDLEQIRDRDLATSGMWIDHPFSTGIQSFDFDADQFPDPAAMFAHAHALGIRMAVWHVPYLSADEVPALEAEASSSGYYPPVVPPIVVNEWGTPIDFSNPEAVAWWQAQLAYYKSLGVEGYKLDYAEDVVVGLNGGRLAWQFADGSDERTMHSDYPALYHSTYDAMLPSDGGFLLCRAGAWGGQAYASVIWPGDLDATLDGWGETTTKDGEEFVAVGGLPAAVSASMGLGPSGFPFFASDTGGYRHSPPNKETFVRWYEHTALTATMQIGTSSSDVAWEFTDQNGFDDESLAGYAAFTRLHLRLFPYVWTYAENLATDGRAIVRPVGLAFPELGVHPADEYLLGDWILVAPVTREGVSSREVAFPDGRWIDWFTGETFDGGTATVDAPLMKLPLYLHEGAIVPMLRPTIDTLSPTTVPDRVDSYDTDPGVLSVRIFGGPLSEFTVYDGTVIRQRQSPDGLVITTAEGSAFTAGYELEVVGIAEGAAVTIDGAPAEAAWTPDVGGTVAVSLTAGAHEVMVR